MQVMRRGHGLCRLREEATDYAGYEKRPRTMQVMRRGHGLCRVQVRAMLQFTKLQFILSILPLCAKVVLFSAGLCNGIIILLKYSLSSEMRTV